MAVVYRVRHQTLGTVHALKVLQTDNAAVRSRLVAEGQLQARIRHPHVVAVTDVLDLDGAPALLMDFVGGGSLADHLRGGPLRLDDALRLFRGVVAGVGHAHDHGLVHRDLKPANVLLATDGPDPVPKVTDFGLAKMVEESMVREHQTRAGQAMGTPAYMAPEQIRDARSADQRADLWSLGVMLYELSTGARPFEEPDVIALMYAVAQGRYRLPGERRPDLPAAVQQAIAGCLQVEREARIPDCATLLEVLDGRPWMAPPPPAPAGVDQTWDPDAGPGRAAPRPTGADVVPTGAPASQTFDPAMVEPAPPTLELASLFAAEPRPPGPRLPPGPVEVPAADDSPSIGTPTATATATPPPAEVDGAGVVARTVTALVVDETGRGHAVELVVALIPGGRGVWAPDGVERDARVAAQVAIAVALGSEAGQWGARWGVRSGAVALHGTSIGLAVALAARAARLGAALPAGWALTGGLDLDGSVVSVGGLPAKLRAARAAGRTHVAAPAEDAGRVQPEPGVALVGTADFESLARQLLAPRRPRALPLAQAAAGLLLPAALAWSGALLLPEAVVEQPLLRAVGRELALDDVLVLGVDTPDPRSLRSRHAETLDALVEAGARAVLVDLALTAATEHDAEIAAAARRAQEAGVPVVLAVRFDRDGPVLPESPELAALPLGTVEAAQDPLLGWVHGLRVRRRDASGASWWSLWARGAGAAVGVGARPGGGDEPALDGAELVVGVLRAPAEDEVLVLPPFPDDVPEVPYGEAERYALARGRVVVVGAFGGTDDVHRTADGPRYGPELQAAAVQALLRQQAPRRLGAEWRAVLALLAGLGPVLLGLRLPARLRPVAALPALAVLAVSLALAAGGVLVGLSGVFLGGLGGLWALRVLWRSRPEPLR